MRRFTAVVVVVAMLSIFGSVSGAAASAGKAQPVEGTAVFGPGFCTFGPVSLSIGGELHTGVVCGLPLGPPIGHGLPSGVHQFSFSYSDCFLFDGADFFTNCAFDPSSGFSCVGVGDCLAANGTNSTHAGCGPDGFLHGCLVQFSEGNVKVTGGSGDFEGAKGSLHYNAETGSPHQVRGVVIL